MATSLADGGSWLNTKMAENNIPDMAKTLPLSGREPEIHVMPGKYMGAALHASIPKAPRVVSGTVAPVVAKSSGQPLPPGVVPAGKPQGPAKGLIIGGVALVLVVGGVAAALLIPRKPTPTAPGNANLPVNVPVVTAPVATTPTTTPAEATSTVPETIAVAPRNAPDTDADGLTDQEETEIYRTDVTDADTDHDGYLDGSEVFYLYNAAGIAPVTLKESGLVRIFEGDGYSLLVPSVWIDNPASNGDGRVFMGQTGESVVVTVEENPAHLSLLDWYSARYSDQVKTDILQFVNRTGLAGIKSPDGLMEFFSSDGKVIALRYDLSGQSEIHYRRTLEMTGNGLKLGPVPATENVSATSTVPVSGETGVTTSTASTSVNSATTTVGETPASQTSGEMATGTATSTP